MQTIGLADKISMTAVTSVAEVIYFPDKNNAATEVESS